MYYIYMMTNKNKTVLYTGVTNNLPRRVYEHKNRIDKRSFTARYNLNLLVYYEATSDIRIAIAREKQIKNLLRRKKEELITAFNPEWNDLMEELNHTKI